MRKDRHLAGGHTDVREMPAEGGQLHYHIQSKEDGHVRGGLRA
jgi:hypothetical protein